MKVFRLLSTLIVLFTVSAVVSAQDAKKVWKEIVKPCAVSELQGNKVIFLGLSNSVEVGTLLRPRRGQGGYGRASFQNVINEYLSNPSSPKPMPKPVDDGVSTACNGKANKTRDLKANVSFLSAALPFVGDFGAALSNATVTSGTVDKVTMYDMDELVMARVLESLPTGSQVRSALLLRNDDRKPVWYMVSRAFRVEGLKARIDFKRKMDVGFQAKYKGSLTDAGVGELGGGLNAAWISDSVLELTSTQPFYIAAELSFYKEPGRFESAGRRNPFEAVTGFGPGVITDTSFSADAPSR